MENLHKLIVQAQADGAGSGIDTWQPTMQLRWVNREVNLKDCSTEMGFKSVRAIFEKVLQQLWVSNNRERVWRDIPLVDSEK